MARLNVDDSGRTIYYEHYRGNGSPVVLIHGWGMSCRVWDGTISALLGADHEVVAFDQRACGQSDKDFDDASLESGISDVLQLIRHLSLTDVVLNGWSLGGALAIGAAAQLGQRCKGVILTCGATPRYEQADDFPYGLPKGSVAGSVQGLQQDRANVLYQLSMGCFPEDPGAGIVQWLSSIFKQSSPRAVDTIADLETLDQRSIMAAIEAPILNVIGAKDAVADPEVGRQAVKMQKNGSLCEFPESGHAPFLDNPVKYNQDILKFIANCQR